MRSLNPCLSKMTTMTKTTSKLQLWINSMQRDYMLASQDFAMLLCGRGSGKTTAIGIKHRKRAAKLPQAKFFLSSSTYKQILNSSLPVMEEIWKKTGLMEYDWKSQRGHYVIGQKPPSHFLKPFKAPRHYEHVITFYNGYTIELLSMDRPSPNRGGSFDGGDLDEACLVKREYIEQVMIPMIRGNKDRYGYDNPLHGKFAAFTSMPWLSTGQWVLDYEAKAKEDPKSFLWLEATAECNLKAVGYDYFEKMQKFLTPEVFNVEVRNQRRISGEIQFYYNFDDRKHVYKPSISYKEDPAGRGIIDDAMSDYNNNQVLDMSFDLSGRFLCALIFQQTHDRKDSTRITENMIDSFYMYKGSSIDQLIDNICFKYSGHRLKYVRMYGEPHAHDASAHGRTLFEKAADKFISHGWRCDNMVAISQADSHAKRFVQMNEMLAETHNKPKLRINQDTCKAPILSIQFTERTHDGKKDKSKERDDKFDQKLAPHFTDALDYYFTQKYFTKPLGTGLDFWII